MLRAFATTVSFVLLLPLFTAAEKSGGAANNKLASPEELYKREAFANPKDNPDLPKVLLTGDSISIGYTPYVRKALKESADVYRIPENARDTSHDVAELDNWLTKDSRTWDVIHFNWGLWDLCYRNPKAKTQGRRDKVDGTLTTTEADYQANLEKLVARLKETNATLIWCATTPVPASLRTVFTGADRQFPGKV